MCDSITHVHLTHNFTRTTIAPSNGQQHTTKVLHMNLHLLSCPIHLLYPSQKYLFLYTFKDPPLAGEVSQNQNQKV